ncbi:MAG: UbiA family prenyltransferase [Halobacteriota archaeon]|jgi:geranylgeranylglycerol-phosphate geranylgeranyltransferase
MQISQNVRAFLTLMRLPYIIVLSFLCVLFIVTFQKGLNDPALIGLAVIAVTFTSAGSAAINDYCDRDSDVLTHPERPISANQITPSRAAQFSALTFLVALGASFLINPVAFGIVALNVVLFIVYARVIKRFSGFVSNLVMGYLGATIALFSGAVVFQTINAASLSFVGLIAGGAIGLNVLKDILTLEGDLKAGYPTLAAKHGIRVAAIVGALFLLLSTITSPMPFFVGVVSVAYLFPIAVWGSVAIAVSLTLLTASNSESVVKRLRIFTTYWPYVVGVACVAYILPFAIWGVP